MSPILYSAIAIESASAAATATPSPSVLISGTVDDSCATVSSLWAQASGKTIRDLSFPPTVRFDLSARRLPLDDTAYISSARLIQGSAYLE